MRLAAPTLALLAGLIYAGAELLRQQAVPSPPGVPGDSGGSAIAVIALGILVAAGPARTGAPSIQCSPASANVRT